MEPEQNDAASESLHDRAEAALGCFDEDAKSQTFPATRWSSDLDEELQAGSDTGKLLMRK